MTTFPFKTSLFYFKDKQVRNKCRYRNKPTVGRRSALPESDGFVTTFTNSTMHDMIISPRTFAFKNFSLRLSRG